MLDSSIKHIQEGSGGNDRMRAVATVSGGGVVLAGHTDGDWNGASPEGGIDFAAVRLDSAGTVIWRWKVKPRQDDHEDPLFSNCMVFWVDARCCCYHRTTLITPGTT